MRKLNREVGLFEDAAASGKLGDERSGGGLVSSVNAAAKTEWAEGARNAAPGEIRDRLEQAMRGAMRRELKGIEKGLPFLATLGSAAPFIGLFGTVWGIMNSFTAIAQSKDTSFAVVAPGIAEALFATAVGLLPRFPPSSPTTNSRSSLGRASDKISPAIAVLARSLARRGAEANH